MFDNRLRNELSLTAEGDLTVKWDDMPAILATDSRFPKGKIGLWTNAASVTALDDLQATAE